MTVRVLIVDDQEPFRMAARMVVDATEGFDVVGEAESGEDSVAMAAELTPDLVLMDVNLPGINGLDATRQILAGAGTDRTPSSCCCSRRTRRTSTRRAPRSAAPPRTSRKRYSARTGSKPPGPPRPAPPDLPRRPLRRHVMMRPVRVPRRGA